MNRNRNTNTNRNRNRNRKIIKKETAGKKGRKWYNLKELDDEGKFIRDHSHNAWSTFR
jgi:hypothetical protein